MTRMVRSCIKDSRILFKNFLESLFIILVSLAAVLPRVNLCGLTETIDNTILIFQLIEYKK